MNSIKATHPRTKPMFNGRRHERTVNTAQHNVTNNRVLVNVKKTGDTQMNDMAEMADKLADANVMIKARLGRASCQPAYKDLAWTVIPKMIKLSIKTMISLAKVMVNISA
jgi:hypothetical protein